MTMLILGLVIFLGVHSVRIFAEPWRTRMRAQLGENGFKGLYSVPALLGFVLIVYGYGAARLEPIVLWSSPVWTRHLASLLTLLAFLILFGAYVPGNAIKAKLHHPMVIAVKTWAAAHLIANNTLADVLLFGSFLVWAALSFRAARARDRAAGVVYPAGRLGPTLATLALGLVAWALVAFWAHLSWFGVRPFGA